VRERIAIGVGLAVVLAALAAVLTVPKNRENGTNAQVDVSAVALDVPAGRRRCQLAEPVPAHTSGVRVYMGTHGRSGGPVDVRISVPHGRTYTATLPLGRRDGPTVAELPRIDRDVPGATVCFVNRGRGVVSLAGNLTEFHPGVRPKRDPRENVRLDWLRGERASLWEFAPEAARRFALFKPGFAGEWTFYALIGVVFLLAGAAILTVLRAPRRPWSCAAIAAGTAAVWALLVPAFWTPDEPVHIGYVQYLAETGKVPRELVSTPELSQEENIAYQAVGFRVLARPPYRADADRRADMALRAHPGRVNPRSAGSAVNNPPLYYALEAVPYRVLHGAGFWDRLFGMRLLSALLAGLTVALTFLFLRELMPGTRWAWSVGALAVAFQPVFGFIGGGVNNDNLVWACGAAVLLALARAFRLGLTPARGAAVAGALLVGVLSKPSIYGVIPGVALGLALAVWRSAPELRRRALAGAGTAAVVVGGPALVYLIANQVLFHRSGTTAISGFQLSPLGGSIRAQVSYLWQSFLPKLPFMQDQFPGYPHFLLWDTYVQPFIGRFGWFEYGFPEWANWLGLGLLLIVLALAAAGLARTGALRRRWVEPVTYAAMLVGMLVTVGLAGYRYRLDTGDSFEQVRYLFVLIALWGAVVAAAARGAGPTWGRAVGAFLVVLAIGHSALSMVLTVERFYG
jgi:hypothetical protein